MQRIPPQSNCQCPTMSLGGVFLKINLFLPANKFLNPSDLSTYIGKRASRVKNEEVQFKKKRFYFGIFMNHIPGIFFSRLNKFNAIYR